MWEVYGTIGDDGMNLKLIKIVKTLDEVYAFAKTVYYKVQAYNQVTDEWVKL